VECEPFGQFVQTSFSIAVAIYLLIRMEGKMGELNESIRMLIDRVDRMSFMKKD